MVEVPCCACGKKLIISMQGVIDDILWSRKEGAPPGSFLCESCEAEITRL